VTAPTPPIAFGVDAGAVRAREGAPDAAVVPSTVVERLRSACADVRTDIDARAEASRDWWPVAMAWALDGRVAGLADVVARPSSVGEVAAVVAICNEARVPLTTAGGRSGVTGASVPVHGGVVLDTTGLSGIVSVSDTDLVVDVRAGTFGDDLEHALQDEHGLTVGHWPQSMALSTVGGWLACRGAGQLSNRYGKIEDIVLGLDVVLADGTSITTGGFAREAVGPDLSQFFVGSEGTLGVITGARLRTHPRPHAQRRAAYGFASFGAANEACRRIVRRGAHPAVLRVYDEVESARSCDVTGTNALLVHDEGDDALVAATMAIVAEECRGADPLDAALVDHWFEHRNDVSALEALVRKGFVVDTMEITVAWSRLGELYDAVTTALMAAPHARAASAHQSHAYESGACVYFTFAATPPPGEYDATYAALWRAGTAAALAHGGSLSHHHGVGRNRGPFVRAALGPAFAVLAAAKAALDPNGILNPGKLGLVSPWDTGEEPSWP
jgi:alkyldihydroxyacetonephosphate synthase